MYSIPYIMSSIFYNFCDFFSHRQVRRPRLFRNLLVSKILRSKGRNLLLRFRASFRYMMYGGC